jgi:hypothetical protein
MIEIQQKQSYLYRTHSKRIDYLDIIIAANVINGPVFPAQASGLPSYSHIPALQRLNITEASIKDELEATQTSIQEARFIFQSSP